MPIYILKLYRYIYTYKSMTKNSMCMCKTNKRKKNLKEINKYYFPESANKYNII